MTIDKNAILQMVLRDPNSSPDNISNAITTTTTKKTKSSFYGDLIANIKLWLRPLVLVTLMWIMLSTVLIIVAVDEPSKFGQASPKDIGDIIYYVVINLTAGFDDYHPYSLWTRLITVANLVFGLAIVGMIVAIFTSAMTPETGVSVQQPQELVGSIEISQLTGIAANQEKISSELDSLRQDFERIASDQKAKTASIQTELLDEIHFLRREVGIYAGNREAEIATIREELRHSFGELFDDARTPRFKDKLDSALMEQLRHTAFILERYAQTSDRPRSREHDEHERSKIHQTLDQLNSILRIFSYQSRS